MASKKRNFQSNHPNARRQRRDIVKTILTDEEQDNIINRIHGDLLALLSTEQIFAQTGKKGKFSQLRDNDLSRTVFWRREEHPRGDEKRQFMHVARIRMNGNYQQLVSWSVSRYRELALELLEQSEQCTPETRQGLSSDMTAYVNAILGERSLDRIVTDDEIISALLTNPNCRKLKQIQLHRKVLDNIPDDITLLFPEARKIKRHFILHVGDTNSGKTYQALQDFKKAASGTYLAPLRLLALETQERLMDEQIPCSMLTGEEENLVPGANHLASTIEMLNTEREYEVAVIDEAQMIADESRGWAWTRAILGVNAPKIHVCMSENALNLVKQLIFSCGDTYETVMHHRDTPLTIEREPFDFPMDIRPHDALIVFSRKNVIYVAGELERKGKKVSIIYGSLPYEVRKNELAKFLSGETDIVVSTDAIGMGMNLPVRRIVFLEGEKYDGKRRRPLTGPEVKQIAGRAGRRGLYEHGYVNALEDKERLRDLFYEKYVPIEKARIQMPERLLDLDSSLSETITSWIRVTDNGIYEKTDAELILEKCKFMEDLNENGYKTPLTKQEMWKFSLVPFDEGKQEIYDLWRQLVRSYYNEEDPFEDFMYFLSFDGDLNELEADYKKLDLMFSFSRAIGYNKDDFRSTVSSMKSLVSDKIIKKLRDVSSEKRRCKRCGRELSWNYTAKMCNRCRQEAQKMGGSQFSRNRNHSRRYHPSGNRTGQSK